MRSVNTKHLLVSLFITLFAVSCKKDALIAPEVEPVVKGKFENGFFISICNYTSIRTVEKDIRKVVAITIKTKRDVGPK